MDILKDHYNHRYIISSEFFEYNLDYKKNLENYLKILKKIERSIKIRKVLNDTKRF